MNIITHLSRTRMNRIDEFVQEAECFIHFDYPVYLFPFDGIKE